MNPMRILAPSILALTLGTAFAGPDLTVNLQVNVLASSDSLRDSIEVMSFITNNGDSAAVNPNGSLVYLDLRIDSVSFKTYSKAQNEAITFSDFLTHTDTVAVPKRQRFSVLAWVDPDRVSGESASALGDNLTSQALALNPIVVDTVYIDSCPPTLIRPPASLVGGGAPLPTAVYDLRGKPVWRGMAAPGSLGAEIGPGLYLVRQGGMVRQVRVLRKP